MRQKGGGLWWEGVEEVGWEKIANWGVLEGSGEVWGVPGAERGGIGRGPPRGTAPIIPCEANEKRPGELTGPPEAENLEGLWAGPPLQLL